MTRTLLVAVAATVACARIAAPPVSPPTDAHPLPLVAVRAYDAIAPVFPREAAMAVVAFMQQYWRLAGNPGYNASLDEIRQRLVRAGFADGSNNDVPFVRLDEYPATAPGWDHSVGTVAIEGDPVPVLSRARDRVPLAINSFSTPAGGLVARLVDIGRGTPADYDRANVRGAVVLGDAGLGVLWREAVRGRGAAGVISTEIAPYIRPRNPDALTEEQKDVLQWGSIPYDEARRGFGFKASWRAAERLRDAMKQTPGVRVRVEIASSFHTGPHRSVVAEIPGRSRPHERIVIVAHVQEPGANDNASGCGTMVAMASALRQAIRSGAVAPPERTLTFMWLDEMRGSRQWLKSRPDEARGVQYMFSMDMTGQNTDRTGGTFLIEKQADPTSAWPRPSDPNSEWGATRIAPESLKGSLLNDLHIAVARHRARDTGWIVRTNPYEGGSDHTVFAEAGVPSLLNWHFTDRYYHTNLDTIDKVSPDEMANVGIAVATSAYALASADIQDALAALALLERAAAARLALERQQGAALVAAAPDRAAAEKVEVQVIAAWIKWYEEAFDSVLTLPASGATSELRAAAAAARARLQGH